VLNEEELNPKHCYASQRVAQGLSEHCQSLHHWTSGPPCEWWTRDFMCFRREHQERQPENHPL